MRVDVVVRDLIARLRMHAACLATGDALRHLFGRVNTFLTFLKFPGAWITQRKSEKTLIKTFI
jgi:hypothetical protein